MLQLTRRSVKHVGFLCDLEGDYSYWQKFIKRSKILEASAEPGGPPNLRDGCAFVFGGDAVDKGGGDLAVLRDLVSIKERYPDRVHLILGNRDINKMRFLHELSNESCSVDSHPGTYWVGLKKPPVRDVNDSDASDRAVIAKWMLQNTMGCPKTFELRKGELARALNRDVTVDEVAADFLRSVLPSGEMAEYLKHSELIVSIGDVLFAHGAVWSGALGAVPVLPSDSDKSMPTYNTTDGSVVTWNKISFDCEVDSDSSMYPVVQWAAQLNAFARSQVDNFMKCGSQYLAGDGPRPHPWAAAPWCSTGGYTGDAGAGLLQLGMGWAADKTRVPSVVYANNLRKDGSPSVMSPDVRNALVKCGVSTVVNGHQPFSDGPLIISNDGLRVITADTSYSNDTIWEGVEIEKRSKAPNVKNKAPSFDVGNGSRGHAVNEVVFEFHPSEPRLAETNFHGVLSNGEEYDFTLPAPQSMNKVDAGSAESVIGHEITDGWWARSILQDGRLLLTKAEGFKCTNRVCEVEWANEKLAERQILSK